MITPRDSGDGADHSEELTAAFALRRVVADLLNHSGIAVRVGEVSDAGVVGALRICTGLPVAQPADNR
jgi:hypothetical protein